MQSRVQKIIQLITKVQFKSFLLSHKILKLWMLAKWINAHIEVLAFAHPSQYTILMVQMTYWKFILFKAKNWMTKFVFSLYFLGNFEYFPWYSRRTKWIPQSNAETQKQNPNIIWCNFNEIDLTMSNIPIDNSILPATHEYNTSLKLTKSKMHIIPPLVDKPILCCSSYLLLPKTSSTHTIHALTLQAALQPFPREFTYLVFHDDTKLAQKVPTTCEWP